MNKYSNLFNCKKKLHKVLSRIVKHADNRIEFYNFTALTE